MVLENEAVDASAFDLPGDPASRVGVLCVHGLTGTPYEVRPLGLALAARGMRARGPLLPGHGTRPEELAALGYASWVGAVEAEYRALRDGHEWVAVLGLSLGGLLTLELASRERPDAIAVIGTPLALRPPIPQLIPLAKYIKPMLAKGEGSDIRDPAARARHPGYKQMPLASVHELVRLQRRVSGRLGEVRSPALVAHGAHDRTADPRDAQRIFRELGSSVKEELICPESGHVVPVDVDGPWLAERVADFIADQLAEAGFRPNA
ncbi:MAG: alpha/beta hydrolase [Myxococcota bacterium]|jgi:carboxylesterase|nr:alpha/beta hydrolase [Myxococcota bacterium]